MVHRRLARGFREYRRPTRPAAGFKPSGVLVRGKRGPARAVAAGRSGNTARHRGKGLRRGVLSAPSVGLGRSNFFVFFCFFFSASLAGELHGRP